MNDWMWILEGSALEFACRVSAEIDPKVSSFFTAPKRVWDLSALKQPVTMSEQAWWPFSIQICVEWHAAFESPPLRFTHRLAFEGQGNETCHKVELRRR